MTDTERRPADAAVDQPAAKTRESARRLVWETIAVLGVSFLMSGLYALLYLIRSELTVKGGIGGTVATVVSGAQTSHPWLDLAYNLLGVLNGLFPVLLAVALLAATPGGRGLGIGLDRTRIGRESLQGVGFLALIGIPGLGLVWAAHALGANAQLDVVDFPDVWYRVPYLLLSAFQNGIAEEVVVLAFLLTRLRQLGWTNQRALLAESTLRGSYHLYQGFGGFAGNFVMGLIFGWVFQRTRRVWPMIVAHFLLDAFSFVGYLYLHRYISWI